MNEMVVGRGGIRERSEICSTRISTTVVDHGRTPISIYQRLLAACARSARNVSAGESTVYAGISSGASMDLRTSSHRANPSGSGSRRHAYVRGPLAPSPATIAASRPPHPALPCLPWCSPDAGASRPTRTPRRRRQHVGLAPCCQEHPQMPTVAGDRVGHHPRRRKPGIQRAAQHPFGQLGLGGKRHRVRDTRLDATRSVSRPFGGHIELPVDEGLTLRRRIRQKDPIWQFSMRPAVPLYCRLTPTECVPCLRNPVLSMTSTASPVPK